MTKESFLKSLINVTPEQINKIIEQKGKKPKLINVFAEIKQTTKNK